MDPQKDLQRSVAAASESQRQHSPPPPGVAAKESTMTRLKTPRRIRPANVEPSQVTWQSSMGRLLPRAPEMTLHDHLLVSADGYSRCVPVTLKRTRRPASPTGHAVPPVRQRDDRRPNQERRRWPKSVGYGRRPPGLRDP